MKNAQSTLAKLVEVALRRFEMIREGDRILVAVSGGKDSTALAHDLALKRRWWGEGFELRAIHITADFSACGFNPALPSLLESWGLDYVDLKVPVLGRLKPGKSMNCYWCSTQRRTELIRYAMAEGFTKIALGHHLDDIVETLLMNMLYKGELSGMRPRLKYDKYPLEIIRPLALCEERQIVDCVTELGLAGAVSSCEFGLESKRRQVRAKVKELTGGSSELKRNLFESMDKVNLEYLGRVFSRSQEED